MNVFFFFSSRRRHTRYWRDWSSDVCSSDLDAPKIAETARPGKAFPPQIDAPGGPPLHSPVHLRDGFLSERTNGKSWLKIGRASCRERVEISVGAGYLSKNMRVTRHKTVLCV